MMGNCNSANHSTRTPAFNCRWFTVFYFFNHLTSSFQPFVVLFPFFGNSFALFLAIVTVSPNSPSPNFNSLLQYNLTTFRPLSQPLLTMTWEQTFQNKQINQRSNNVFLKQRSFFKINFCSQLEDFCMLLLYPTRR